MPMNMKKTKDEIQREMICDRFLQYDQEKMIELFHLDHDEETMKISFIQKIYTIDRKTALMYEGDRLASIDEMASIYELLTKSDHVPILTGEWKSIAALCTNTTDTSLGRYIEYLKPFEEDTDKMQQALLDLGAEPAKKGDVSAILYVFPNVPVWVQYWVSDEEFPASVQFLFDAGVVDHFRWSLLWNVMTCITDRMLEAAGLLETDGIS